MELVTQQFERIQDKFTYSNTTDSSSSKPTKPWTKVKKFINLTKQRNAYLNKILLCSNEAEKTKLKLELKNISIDINKLYKEKKLEYYNKLIISSQGECNSLYKFIKSKNESKETLLVAMKYKDYEVSGFDRINRIVDDLKSCFIQSK